MKRIVSAFFLRGLVAGGFGPIVLAVVYMILHRAAGVDSLTVKQLVVGIFSLYLLAFVVGGINVIYSIERLPLALAILIHGCALYVCYLATYLLNDWLNFGVLPIMIFTVAFVVGYLAIWAVIYLVNRRNTERVNELLRKKQQSGE